MPNRGGEGARDESKPRGDRPAEAPGGSPPSGGADLGGELLECVVRETLSAVSDETVIERIKQFARENAGCEITDPGIAESLMDSIVRARFGKVPLPAGLPRWLAHTLLEDPVARERLVQVWNRAKGTRP